MGHTCILSWAGLPHRFLFSSGEEEGRGEERSDTTRSQATPSDNGATVPVVAADVAYSQPPPHLRLPLLDRPVPCLAAVQGRALR